MGVDEKPLRYQCHEEIRMSMTLDEVILELYRLAETKKWDKRATDEALAAAIEGMEHIWTLRQSDRRKNASGTGKRQQRIWS